MDEVRDAGSICNSSMALHRIRLKATQAVSVVGLLGAHALKGMRTKPVESREEPSMWP